MMMRGITNEPVEVSYAADVVLSDKNTDED